MPDYTADSKLHRLHDPYDALSEPLKFTDGGTISRLYAPHIA